MRETLDTEYITSDKVTVRADVAATPKPLVYLFVHDEVVEMGATVFLSPEAAEAFAAQLVESAREARTRREA